MFYKEEVENGGFGNDVILDILEDNFDCLFYKISEILLFYLFLFFLF